MSEYILEIKKLNKLFGSTHAVKDVSLAVKKR